MADRVVSPSGKVTWAYIERPNTKFSEEGEYQLAFTIPRKEAKKFMATIDEWMESSQKESGARKWLIHLTKRMEMMFCLSLSRSLSLSLRMARRERQQFA